MIFDFRIKKDPILPVFIKGEIVEIVNKYKYLGITIDDKLEWNHHASNVHAKMSQRLFFLRKLNFFHIDSKLLYLFYSSVIESILLFCFCAWGGNCKASDMNSFFVIIKKSLRICNVDVYHPSTLLDKNTIHKMNRIIKDKSHPLFDRICFSKRKSGRLISIQTKTERHKKSFLPRAVRAINM